MVLYRTSYFGLTKYHANVYDLLIRWNPEQKAYFTVERSGRVAMTAPDTAKDAGMPLVSFIGGATVGRFRSVNGNELKDGAQGTPEALAAYDHTAMDDDVVDDDVVDDDDAQAEADAIQAEADRLAAELAAEEAEASGRTRMVLGFLLIPAALIIRALMWAKK